MNSLLFDLDGTLLDISKRHYALYQSECLLLNIHSISFQMYWNLKRKKINERIILQKRTNIPLLLIDKTILWRQKNIEDPLILKFDHVYPDCIKTLKKLNKKYDLKIITSRNSYVNTIKELSKLNMLSLFSEVIVKGNKKLSYRHIVKEKKSMIIGDTELDYNLAKKLNLPFVFASYGIRSMNTLIEIVGQKPLFSITKISDLNYKLIEKILCVNNESSNL